jgi:hypothetical protein
MGEAEEKEFHALEKLGANSVLNDEELNKLALDLLQTPPSPIDPIFRETLKSKLLDAMRSQDQRKRKHGMNNEQNQLDECSVHREDVVQPNNDEPDTEAIQNDPELATLAVHLRQTTTTVDPVYRDKLRKRLREIAFNTPESKKDNSNDTKDVQVKQTESSERVDIRRVVEEITRLPESECQDVLVVLANLSCSHLQLRMFRQVLLEAGILQYYELQAKDKGFVLHAYKHLKSFLEKDESRDLKNMMFYIHPG